MERWKPGTTITLSSRKFWLRRVKNSFHLYRRLIFISMCIALASALISLSYIEAPLTVALRNSILSLTAPLIKAVEGPFDWARQGQNHVDAWINARRNAENLSRENEVLKETLHSLDALKDEHEALKKFINLKTHLSRPLTTVKVLSYPGRPFIKSLLISAGTGEGVKPQQVVMNEKGLVGRVITVGKGISHILLLTDVNSHVPVVLKGTDIHAILEGDNEGLPFLKYIQTKVVHVGDVLETSGHGGIFPAKIPVGCIEKIEDDKIFIRLFSDLKSLSFVMLINPVINEELYKLVAQDAFDPS